MITKQHKQEERLIDSDETRREMSEMKALNEIAFQILQKHKRQVIPLINLYNQYVALPHISMDAEIELLNEDNQKADVMREWEPFCSELIIRINHKYLYHIEIHKAKDDNMIVRMVEYDMKIAARHSLHKLSDSAYEMEIPNPVVLFMSDTEDIPRAISYSMTFPDGSVHYCEVPTIRIPEYTLNEIREHRLFLFLPYAILKYLNSVESDRAFHLKERTDTFLQEAKTMLYDARNFDYISAEEYQDYMNFICNIC